MQLQIAKLAKERQC